MIRVAVASTLLLGRSMTSVVLAVPASAQAVPAPVAVKP
jgi:hypothetical protein